MFIPNCRVIWVRVRTQEARTGRMTKKDTDAVQQEYGYPEIEPGRVSRALREFDVIPLGEDQFRVHDKEKNYYYYVRTRPYPMCACSDALFHPEYLCKHITAGLIVSNDEALQGRAVRNSSISVLPYRAVDSEGRPYEDTFSLNKACNRMKGRERSKRTASRIITDPAAGLKEWRLVARNSTVAQIQGMLLRIPDVLNDKRSRTYILNNTPDVSIVFRLLPHVRGNEFRIVFRKLVEANKIERAFDVILADPRAIPTLEAEDLAGFLKHPDGEIRKKAFMVMGKLVDEKRSLKGKKKTKKKTSRKQ